MDDEKRYPIKIEAPDPDVEAQRSEIRKLAKQLRELHGKCPPLRIWPGNVVTIASRRGKAKGFVQ